MSNETMALHRIETLVRLVLEKLENVMSGQDDLKAAIAANQAAITSVTAELNALSKQIVAAANGDSDADIETLAQQLEAQTAQLNLAVSNATNPQPAPAPSTGGAAVAPSTAVDQKPGMATQTQPAVVSAGTSEGAPKNTGSTVSGTQANI